MAQRGYSPSTGTRVAHAEDQVSLCELLDRVLNKGAVLTGEIVISVADIDLLYVGVGLVISSVETLLEAMDGPRLKQEPIYDIP